MRYFIELIFFNYKLRNENLHNKNYKNINNIFSYGLYVYFCKEYVFVTNKPISVNFDNNGQLHSINGAAIKFKGGEKHYLIHGIKIDEELWNKINKKCYTLNDFILERNEEVKAACLMFMREKHGDEYLFEFLGNHFSEFDTFVNLKSKKSNLKSKNIGIYTLIKGKVNGLEISYVRCFCPSTDRMFLLSVAPTITYAKDTIASLYVLPKKLIPHIKYINRQGERYSTILTEEVKKFMSNMSMEYF